MLSIVPPDGIYSLLENTGLATFYIVYENEYITLPCKFGDKHLLDYSVNNKGWICRFTEYEPSESEILYKNLNGEFVTQEIAEKMFEAASFLFLDKTKYYEEMKKILNR